MFLPVPAQAQDFDKAQKVIDIASKRGPVLGQDTASAYAKRQLICAKLYQEQDFLNTPELQQAVLEVFKSDRYTFSNGWRGDTEMVFNLIVEEALALMEGK